MSSVRIRYQTIEFDTTDIHIRSLKDNQQFSDPFGEAEQMGVSSAQWPLFGIIWALSEVLAHEMLSYVIDGKRILEVGCGLGLSSLLLNARHADITATDIHSEAGRFLAENVKLNGGSAIPFLRTGWKDVEDGLGVFDVVIGSDVLYERSQVELLSKFIDRHTNTNCEVILVDPGRSHHAPFSKAMVSLGYSHSQYAPAKKEYVSGSFKGQVLRYKRGDGVEQESFRLNK